MPRPVTVEQLKALSKDFSLSRVPSRGALHDLVSQQILHTGRIPEITRALMLDCWKAAPSSLSPEDEAEIIAEDKVLWANIELNFSLCDVGKLPQMHDKLAPYPEWRPGQQLLIQNWPTLAQPGADPDAGLWDAGNASHCSINLEREGWRKEGVCVIDWTPPRFSNTLTGKHPNNWLSSDTLGACDAWIMHRLRWTFFCAATAVFVSGWCKERFLGLCRQRHFTQMTKVIDVPIVDDAYLSTSLTFAGVKIEGEMHLGKVFFRPAVAHALKCPRIGTCAEGDISIALAQAASLHIFPAHEPPPLWILRSARDMSAEDNGMIEGVHHLALVEELNATCFRDEQALHAEGCEPSFPLRLRGYWAAHAAELAIVQASLPELRRDSLVAAPAQLMAQRRVAICAAEREFDDLEGGVTVGTVMQELGLHRIFRNKAKILGIELPETMQSEFGLKNRKELTPEQLALEDVAKLAVQAGWYLRQADADDIERADSILNAPKAAKRSFKVRPRAVVEQERARKGLWAGMPKVIAICDCGIAEIFDRWNAELDARYPPLARTLQHPEPDVIWSIRAILAKFFPDYELRKEQSDYFEEIRKAAKFIHAYPRVASDEQWEAVEEFVDLLMRRYPQST